MHVHGTLPDTLAGRKRTCVPERPCSSLFWAQWCHRSIAKHSMNMRRADFGATEYNTSRQPSRLEHWHPSRLSDGL